MEEVNKKISKINHLEKDYLANNKIKGNLKVIFDIIILLYNIIKYSK